MAEIHSKHRPIFMIKITIMCLPLGTFTQRGEKLKELETVLCFISYSKFFLTFLAFLRHFPIYCKHKPVHDKNHNNVLFLETLLYPIKSVNIKNVTSDYAVSEYTTGYNNLVSFFQILVCSFCGKQANVSENFNQFFN